MGGRPCSYGQKTLLLRAEDLGLQAEGVEPSEGGGVRPSGVEGVGLGDKLAGASAWAVEASWWWGVKKEQKFWLYRGKAVLLHAIKAKRFSYGQFYCRPYCDGRTHV